MHLIFTVFLIYVGNFDFMTFESITVKWIQMLQKCTKFSRA